MALDTAGLLTQIDSLLRKKLPIESMQAFKQGIERDKEAAVYAVVVETMQGTLTLAQAVYGAGQESPQVQTLMKAAQQARDVAGVYVALRFGESVWPVVQGTLRAMRADVEASVVGSIERRATGEVLADMLGLAREALADKRDGTRNVAAVLTAAAYEDAIRKMGATLATVQGRPDLADVLTASKQAKVLVGAPLSIALGYLKFRNDALHADWANLNDAVVGSCLTFVEGLVLQHLS
jgi:hypothetical protein